MQAAEIAKAPAVAQKKKMAAFISTPWILSQEILNRPMLCSCKQVIKDTQILKNKDTYIELCGESGRPWD
jgi:hypothetical protein